MSLDKLVEKHNEVKGNLDVDFSKKRATLGIGSLVLSAAAYGCYEFSEFTPQIKNVLNTFSAFSWGIGGALIFDSKIFSLAYDYYDKMFPVVSVSVEKGNSYMIRDWSTLR